MLYIDTHLSRAIGIKELADIACFSPFHFQRIFLTLVGETVGQYQQRKRLERATQLLMEDQKSILEIALETGYETPAALTKLFKRWTGDTPTSFRRKLTPSDLDSFHPLKPSRLSKKINLYPIFQELPELIFIFIEISGMQDGKFTKVAQPAFEEMYHWVLKNHLMENVRFWLGMIPYKPSNYQDSKASLWFGIAFEELPSISIPFSILNLPAGKVAVFKHCGPYDYLLQTWNCAYQRWLPESGYMLRDMSPFERYLTNPKNTPPENTIAEVCIPIY